MIDIAGVAKKEILHDFGKGNISYLNHEMDMVGHQTKGMNPMTVTLHAFLEQKIKTDPVGPVKEDTLTVVAAEDHAPG